jgi:hypothetical protein
MKQYGQQMMMGGGQNRPVYYYAPVSLKNDSCMPLYIPWHWTTAIRLLLFEICFAGDATIQRKKLLDILF